VVERQPHDRADGAAIDGKLGVADAVRVRAHSHRQKRDRRSGPEDASHVALLTSYFLLRTSYVLLPFFVLAVRDDCEVAHRFVAGAEVLMPVRSAGNAAERSGAVLGAVRRAGLDRSLVFLQVARFRPDVVSGTLEDDEDRLVAVLVRVGLRPDELAD